MRNSIGDWFLLVLMMVLLVVVFFAMSFLYLAIISAGPQIVLEVMIVATATVFALNWWLGFMLFDMTVDHPHSWALMFALVVAASSAVVPATLLVEGHAERAALEADAPLARDFALQHFDELDSDRSGIITDGELGAAEDDSRFSANERILIGVLKAQIDLAGHVTGSYQTWVPITTTIPCGKGCVMPVTNMVQTTVYIYGISRNDLPGFPERVHEKWEKW